MTATDKRCGTCAYYVFGMRPTCAWKWTPGVNVLSAAFHAGGFGHAMGPNDGTKCETWETSLKTAKETL